MPYFFSPLQSEKDTLSNGLGKIKNVMTRLNPLARARSETPEAPKASLLKPTPSKHDRLVECVLQPQSKMTNCMCPCACICMTRTRTNIIKKFQLCGNESIDQITQMLHCNMKDAIYLHQNLNFGSRCKKCANECER